MTRDFLQAHPRPRRGLRRWRSSGATLESFDLSLEDDYALPGRAHEVLNLRRPDVIRDVHAAMIGAGAEVLETNTFQASRLKLAEWGLDDHTHEINVAAAHLARDAAGEDRFVAGCMGPTGLLPASDDPTLGAITPAALTDVFVEQSGALLAGGVDLLIIETVQDILEAKAAIFGARRAMAAAGRTVPIQVSVSLLPASGPTDARHRRRRGAHDARGAACRRHRPELLDRPGRHARRDPLPGRARADARPLHPQRWAADPGPRRRDDLPGVPRGARGDARRVRRALRRRHRRRLLRHHARSTSPCSRRASRASSRPRGRPPARRG